MENEEDIFQLKREYYDGEDGSLKKMAEKKKQEKRKEKKTSHGKAEDDNHKSSRTKEKSKIHMKEKKKLKKKKENNTNNIHNVSRRHLHSRNKQIKEKNKNNLQSIYTFISNYVLKEENDFDETDDNEYSLLNREETCKDYMTQPYHDLDKGDFEVKTKKKKKKKIHKNKNKVHLKKEENAENEDEENKEKDLIKKRKEKENWENENVDIENCKKGDSHEYSDSSTNNKGNYEEQQENRDKIIESDEEREKESEEDEEDEENYYSDDDEECEGEDSLQSEITKLSTYFNFALKDLDKAEKIFEYEKKLTRHMSYYNDAYYYTSEMIYKNNKKNKQKFALYLRLISLFINIVIGIYLITNFPHFSPNVEVNLSSKYTDEYEQLKKNIIRAAEWNEKYQKVNAMSQDNGFINKTAVSNQKGNSFFKFFLHNANEKGEDIHQKKENEKKTNNNSSKQEILNEKGEQGNISLHDTSEQGQQSRAVHDDLNNFIKEIDIVSLIADENIMKQIYMEMNKIYKYVVYSFFGELLAISIFLFSLIILKLLIHDSNKFSVILTIYGILYKLFCYVFAHYVLFMGIYILSMYCSIYINKDIYENSFNFVCYHFVYSNLFMHVLMLFYAFQNILFTINDTFNSLRMFFIIFKHLLIKIYDKLTCQNFVTFYEIKEDKPLLPLTCVNGVTKNKCYLYKNWCNDKSCAGIDVEEDSIEYTDRSENKIANENKTSFQVLARKKSYSKGMNLKTYEQSLLNMKNPVIKYTPFSKDT